MKKLSTFVAAAIAALATGLSMADTLELYDGTLLEGDFVGSSNGIVMFDTGSGIEAFPEDQVVGIFLSAGVASAEAYYAAGDPGSVTIPEGTRLVIRTTDTIDSSQHGSGHRFRGQLVSALVVDGTTVVARGTFVHGRITQAQQAGRVAGSSELAVEFTDLMINDVLIPISTGGLSAQTQGEGARTVGRTARAAAIGGLASGRSGARTGARIGAGASILTRGANVNIPRGTIVETRLTSPVTVTMP